MRNHALTTLIAGSAALLAVAAPACAADPLTGSAAVGSVDATAAASGSATTLPFALAGSVEAAPELAIVGSALVAPVALPLLALGSAAAGAPHESVPAPVRPAPAPRIEDDPNTYDANAFASLGVGDCFAARDGAVTPKSCTAPHNNQVFAVLHSDATGMDALDMCDDAADRNSARIRTAPAGTAIEAFFSHDGRTNLVTCTLRSPDGVDYTSSYVH